MPELHHFSTYTDNVLTHKKVFLLFYLDYKIWKFFFSALKKKT
jgi:hypothetical protein